MAAKGNLYEHAITGSCFARLECEFLDRHTFRTPSQARTALFDFIDKP